MSAERYVDPSTARHLVGVWLRTRIAHEVGLADRYRYLVKEGDVKAIFQQLAADAEHSALLLRLFEGKDPLPEPPPLRHSYPDYEASEGGG